MKKKHYFLVSYTAINGNNFRSEGRFCLDRNSRNICNETLDFIDNHILKVACDNNATPIIQSISYLGHMTEKEFYDEPTK